MWSQADAELAVWLKITLNSYPSASSAQDWVFLECTTTHGFFGVQIQSWSSARWASTVSSELHITQPRLPGLNIHSQTHPGVVYITSQGQFQTPSPHYPVRKWVLAEMWWVQVT